MAKKKANPRRRRNGITVPIAVVAGFIPGFYNVAEHTRLYGWRGGIKEMGRIYMAFDHTTGNWDWDWLKYGTIPILIGLLAHNLIGRGLGLNRALARARLPVIRF